MTDLKQLNALAETRPWLIAPVCKPSLPLRGDLATFDFLGEDPVATAVERNFFTGNVGELLWVAPGELPVGGVLVIGCGDTVAWDEAMDRVVDHLPNELPGRPPEVVVLSPSPVAKRPPVAWRRAGDRFVPKLGERLPFVRRWKFIEFDATPEPAMLQG